jgi:hypothetical protein
MFHYPVAVATQEQMNAFVDDFEAKILPKDIPKVQNAFRVYSSKK